MTEQEIRALLAIAIAYDNRSPSEANIIAWHEAARRMRWTFDTAAEAIHQHYATTATWIMPGHITELIRAERRQPARFQALPAAEPPTDERVRQVVAELEERLHWHTPTTDPALAVECPHCHAEPGAVCTRPVSLDGKRKPLGRSHPSRAERGTS